MLIQNAYAQETTTAITVPAPGSAVPPAPSASQAFITNMGMVLVLVFLFYILLIKPQQRRFREHSNMLSKLKKGDKVVVAGGLVGTIDKIADDSNEAVIDLGNGMKVTVLRSSIQSNAPLSGAKKA